MLSRISIKPNAVKRSLCVPIKTIKSLIFKDTPAVWEVLSDNRLFSRAFSVKIGNTL